MGGLAAAVDLASAGQRVTLLERAPNLGGKVREVSVGPHAIDTGPTLLRMRWVFDDLFAAAGTALSDHVTLKQAATLGRHAWAGEQRLDLFADAKRSADAIGAFAGAKDAAGFLAFCQQAKRIYETLENRFIKAPKPQGTDLVLSAGPLGLMRLKPLQTLWDAVGTHMKDPRLRQLFSRTSTDYGTPPFQAPAAAMVFAHMERSGVFLVEGGMGRLVDAMARLATGHGAEIRLNCGVKEITANANGTTGVRLDNGEALRADAVVMTGEPSAVATGLLGRGVTRAAPVIKFPQRTLSASTWAVVAEAHGMPLLRRTVCFSRDTRLEFDLINSGRLPTEPTITLIAQDRPDGNAPAPAGPERILLAVNAPASGDRRAFSQVEIDQCLQGMTALMNRCGLELRLTDAPVMTTPATFHRLFPASGGALYGPAMNGPTAPFGRPASRTKMKGLFLAGGSTHPGPGMGAAVLSGRLAAKAVLDELAPPRSFAVRLLGRKN